MKDKKILRRVILVSIVIVVILIAALIPKKKNQIVNSDGVQEAVHSVRTQVIARQDLQEYLTMNGNVQSNNTISVYPENAGKILRVFVTLGSTVRRGDQIALIDPSSPGSYYAASPVVAPISGTITSLLDERLLVNMPNYFSDGAYQNPAGKKFSFKESTQMLLEFPESASYVSQYKGWRVATFALLGICCAGIATDLVCTFNENIPNRQAIYTAASLTSVLSLSGSLFTSSVAGHKYRVAMDCYNLNILGLK